ncbi:unnamed protein product [Chondrus crispus]|nr:unnamed protein product [Chondrus crispus]CDF37792.1 unnamed protein product [Chondrus crispus]|eukprot:XP_005717663.1 unnamed protein product [Chondrus crispus]
MSRVSSSIKSSKRTQGKSTQTTSKSLTKTTVKIHEAPTSRLLTQLTRLQDQEAGWNQTTFDLSVSKPTIAVVYDKNGAIVGSGTLNAMSPQSFWMGNVFVAESMRRRGIGSKLVSELLSHAEAKKSRSSVVLTSTDLGMGMYSRLGFKVVPSIKIVMYARPPTVAPTRSSLKPRVPSKAEHEEAIKFDEKSNGASRASMLRSIYKQYGMCAVLKSGSSIVAVAWGRYLASPTKDHQPELQIGPVVAKKSEYAASVTGELLRMDQGGRSAKKGMCGSAMVLSVQRGNDSKPGMRAFESVGFMKMGEMPYMRKTLGRSSSSSDSKLDLVRASSSYHAMAWWDLA